MRGEWPNFRFSLVPGLESTTVNPGASGRPLLNALPLDLYADAAEVRARSARSLFLACDQSRPRPRWRSEQTATHEARII
jgi:hypothetical protein